MGLPRTTDVLIAGGGPAGSTAATQLAKHGYDVVLVDKAHHPRETVGESILPSAWKFFDLLGVAEKIERHGFVEKTGGMVVWGDEITEIQFRDFEYSRPGLHTERDELDKILLDHARHCGARVFEGVQALRAAPQPEGGVEVALAEVDGGARAAIRCRYFVDATGQSALLPRQAGARKLDDDFRFISLWGYFLDSRYVGAGGVVRDFAEIAEHPPLTLVNQLSGWGWSWHIPMKRTTSVGIVVPLDGYKRDSARYASLDEYLLATCRGTRYLGDCLAGATLTNGPVRAIRDFSYVAEEPTPPGCFVIGDAAGFVDPIFSVGVVMALYSGQLASWAIDRAMRTPAHAESARRIFAHQIRGRYELARTMALPGIEADAPGGARTYFDFFSRAEKALMWSAASMTTRSANLVRTAGMQDNPATLRRRAVEFLQVYLGLASAFLGVGFV
jgi:flavin-dependent dehydrogenase